MYEKYTRQSLPNDDYRELLGSAISVFNSNNAFIIAWNDVIMLNVLKKETDYGFK